MEPLIFFLLFVVLIGISIGIRLFAGSLNHERIRKYVAGQGGSVEDIQWEPFGPGWFGEKSDAIYKIRYIDSKGDRYEAYCKTSMLSGVYLSHEKLLSRKSEQRTYFSTFQDEIPETLEEENHRLKDTIARLEEEIRRLKRESLSK